MARYAFDQPMAVSSSGGSWKSLFYFLLAAAGVGFAGYVYVVPYSKMEKAVGGNQSAIADERRAAETAKAERVTLKPGLDPLGATLMAEPDALSISFPAAKMIDANGIDVSDGGMAAVKIVAETAKHENAKVRIRARSSAAAPPKELRGLFRTAGEMNAVRAARMMSSLEHAGVAPARITIIGDVAEKS